MTDLPDRWSTMVFALLGQPMPPPPPLPGRRHLLPPICELGRTAGRKSQPGKKARAKRRRKTKIIKQRKGKRP